MMTSFYNLLKYAATGQASPDMTYYDRMRASTLMGGAIKTLTGVPPLSFTGNGKPLISWSMLGNGVQNGTPAPDSPVDVVGCGDRTANLFDNALSARVRWVVDNRKLREDFSTKSLIMPCEPETEYTLSKILSNRFIVWGLRSYPVEGGTYYTELARGNDQTSLTFTTGSRDIYLLVMVSYNSSTPSISDIANSVMLNAGSTPLPYEPYGYKIPITCAGKTTPIYLGEVQTVQRIKKLVLDGTENWTLQSVNTYGIANFQISIPDRLQGSPPPMLSSHFVRQATIIADTQTIGFFPQPGGKLLYLRCDSSIGTNLLDFRAWLAQQKKNGTPVLFWYILEEQTTAIVNEPLMKIGTYADELHSTDAAVTIPTARGRNTLTVDTTVQPSSMTITYR